MDHQTALSSQAVERYTLDELTSPQREEFEEHFFNCPDCAGALREYEIFIANTRAVFTEDRLKTEARITPAAVRAQPGLWDRFRGWFAIPAVAFAGIALAVIVLRAPQELNGPVSEWALRADTRDAVEHHAIAKEVVWLAPTIKLQGPASRWTSYHWEIKADPGGKVLDQGDGHGGEAPLTLKVPAMHFQTGKTYKLIVQGDPATRPMASSFIIDRN